MHSDPAEFRKGLRTYWMVGAALLVFTVITVAVNQIHLTTGLAIAVALIIATTKASMVASIFMHLSHERRWIYSALVLTVIGFVILLTVPFLTDWNNIGTRIAPGAHAAPTAAGAAGAAGHEEH
jgi:caa(3)-type oxidase subunit IV